MNTIIIDVAEDITAQLPKLKAAGVKTVFGYLSSINPSGAKCLTPMRGRAVAAAGMTVGLVHEGWGGVGGRGISAADGARDGAYGRKTAPLLGAPKGACVYFACDTDFSPGEIEALVVPYFKAVRAAFADGFYRVGVYGSGAVCAAVKSAGLADLTWIAGSKGWTGYSAWAAKADMVQTVDANIGGISDDSDIPHGDIGDFIPFGPALVPPANALAAARSAAPAANPPPPATDEDYQIGAAALEKLVVADVTADINQQVPSMFRGMIPADMAQQIARQLGAAGAKAVIDAVDAARAARAQPKA